HQLLDLAKLEQTRPIMTEVDLSRLCMACTLPFEAAAFESEILFSYDIKDGIVVKGEASSLEKLISILIDNAISHSEKGTEVILKLEEHLGKAQFTISNSSDEISDEDLSNMFERFYKSDKSRSFTSHYGLGLSIAKSITNLHGGEISVSYSSGRIIFTVIL
nr:HAMP domain-containing histidine kinase [Eubacterium sp.]